MRITTTLILIFIAAVSVAQGPPVGNYTPVAQGLYVDRIQTKAFGVPTGGTPGFFNRQWTGAGQIRYDSVHQRLVVWNGTFWMGMADTTEAGTVTGGSNGDTLVSGNIELGSRLTRATRIDLNNNLFYWQHTSDAIANTLTINLDENDGQVVLDNSGGALIETGFKYIGYDFGLVKNRVQNLYPGTSNGAAVGHDFIDAWGHITQIYQGTPYNAFTSGGLMIRYTGGSMKVHVDSTAGFFSVGIGALGAMATNEQARINQTGMGLGTTVPTHRLTVNGQVRITAIDNASVFDTVLVINDGVVQARLASTIIGATPTLQQVLTAGSTLSSGITQTIDINTGTLIFAANGSGTSALLSQSGYIIGDFNNLNIAQIDAYNATGGLIITVPDSFVVKQAAGYYRFTNLASTIDTTVYKFLVVDVNGKIRRSNSVAQFGGGSGSAALTATYAGYGDGSNVLTGEAAYNYNATTNTLTVDNITTAGAGSTIASAPASGSSIISMKSSAGAFTTTFTYDASRNFISDYRDGEVIRVNGNNVATFNSTGFSVNQGGGTSADFNVRSANFNPFVFVDVSADRMGIGVTTVAQLTNTLTVNGSLRFSTIPTGSAVDSFGTYDNGVLEMVAPADMTGLPYIALTGTSTLTGAVTVATASYASILVLDDNGGSGLWEIGNETANRAIIKGDIGAQTITYRADNGHTFSSGIVTMSAYGAGAATFDASGVISSVSDETAKTDIQYYTGGIDAILRFRPISYRYNGITGNETEHTYLGFSAQNVYSVLGELGTGRDKSGLMTLQDRSILATLVNGEKDLYRMILELWAEIETLKRK